MKHILILLLFPTLMWGQTDPRPNIPKIKTEHPFKRAKWTFAGGFVTGLEYALDQTLEGHYYAFKRVHPKANDQFWNPRASWTNKWKNGDRSQGEKFPGASTLFVSTTDANHLIADLHLFSVLGTGMIITIGEKKPWWWYGINLGAAFIGRGLGFHLVYDKLYHI